MPALGHIRYYPYFRRAIPNFEVGWSRVTHPSATRPCGLVRLACVRHAASVNPEPGSNSPSLPTRPKSGRLQRICWAPSCRGMWTQNRLHSSIVKEQTGLAFGAIPATEPDARRGRRSIYLNSLGVKTDLKAVNSRVSFGSWSAWDLSPQWLITSGAHYIAGRCSELRIVGY